MGGAVVHELSYQQARNHGVPVRGVYVAHPGYMLRRGRLNKGAILESVNGAPTPTLRHFADALGTTAHGAAITVRARELSARSHVHLAPLTMDRKWFPIGESARVDGGDWEPLGEDECADATDGDATDSGAAHGGAPHGAPVGASTAAESEICAEADAEREPLSRELRERALALIDEQRAHADAAMAAVGVQKALEVVDAPETEDGASARRAALERRVAGALVSVDFTRPFCIDGETGVRYRGAGLVVDARRGVVAVDRGTVTSTLGDATVTLGGTATVAARVRYVHPLHNFAIIQYDPASVPAGVCVSEVPLVPRRLQTGAQVTLVGLKSGLNEEFDSSRPVDVVARATRIANSGWMKLPLPNPPRFQVANTETLGLEVSPAVDGGVLADEAGVTALWVSCVYQPAHNQIAQVFRGLPVAPVKPVADAVARGQTPPLWHSLGVSLEPLSLAAARLLGVQDEMLLEVATEAADRPAGVHTDATTVASVANAANAATTATATATATAATSADSRGCVLLVSHARSDALAAGLPLRGGDLLLKVNGQPVCSLLQARLIPVSPQFSPICQPPFPLYVSPDSASRFRKPD